MTDIELITYYYHTALIDKGVIMKLNCDLGESFGAYTMPVDKGVMPHLDLANIACGFHGGDPVHIQRAIQLATKDNVAIGAHPSYPDRKGFGRRHMALTSDELVALLHYQVGMLRSMCEFAGTSCDYVKPHGAWYHDIVKNNEVRHATFKAMQSMALDLPIVLPATCDPSLLVKDADQYGLTIWFEVFADRAYLDDGTLAPRTQPVAVLSEKAALAQVSQLLQHQSVTTISGQSLVLNADTLCVHSDTPAAVKLVKAITQLM